MPAPVHELASPAILPMTKSKVNNFNFLRLLFASLVLVSHAPEIRDGDRSRELLTRAFGTLSFGELAVNGFFLLSGYLILTSWWSKPELYSYFEKRLRRIVPGYVIAFLLSVYLVAPFAVQNMGAYFSALNWHGLVGQLLQLQEPRVPLVFAGRPHQALNASLWSISYEFRCYVLVALLGLLGARLQKVLWPVLLFVCLGLLRFPQLLSWLSFPGQHWVVEDLSLFVRVFAFFCAGACFSLYQPIVPFNGKIALVFAILLGLLLPHGLATIALATLGAYILFWFAMARIPVLTYFQRAPDVSYGLYLYGWPIQKLLDWYFPTISPWVLLPVALLLSISAGYASWRLVEAPFLNRKRATLALPLK
jgi:peptidoglycan/LPS O-acetylase OafA/YrhL